MAAGAAADGTASPEQALRARADAMRAAAAGGEPFSEEELDSAVQSLRNLSDLLPGSRDWAELRELYRGSAHLSHKDWARTAAAGEALRGIVAGPAEAAFRSIFWRVLEDGGWDAAAAAAEKRPSGRKPWVVLVAGVNGIRKTTSVYQAWFKDVLSQALGRSGVAEGLLRDELPDGKDSFFRQLDFIIATAANEEFRALYSVEDEELYASLKDAIFARYRMVAEMCGALLLREAEKRRMNVMVETSGRDVAMFNYIEHFFPGDEYRKLVVYFTINDLALAEESVAERMRAEMSAGRAARGGDTRDVVRANRGGPYGPKVLRKVQADSQQVWEGAILSGQVGASWHKAALHVVGRPGGGEWTVQAAADDGAGAFAFAPLA